MTTPELTEQEKAAGFVRFKAWLDEHVSGFKRGFITDDYIRAGVQEVVAAVDEVRDAQNPNQPDQPPTPQESI